MAAFLFSMTDLSFHHEEVVGVEEGIVSNDADCAWRGHSVAVVDLLEVGAGILGLVEPYSHEELATGQQIFGNVGGRRRRH